MTEAEKRAIHEWEMLLLERVRQGQLEQVDRQLSRGEGVNEAFDAEGLSALHIAARNGNAEMVRVLLRHGADVSLVDTSDCHPISYAASSGNADCVRALIEYGSSLTDIDGKRKLPAQYAAQSGSVEVLRVLVEHKGLLHWSDDEDATPLSWAVLEGHLEAARFIAQNGGDADETLMFLCECGSGTVAQLRFVLDELGADPEEESETGWRPAFLAAQYRRVELLEVLLDHPKTSQDTLDLTLAYLHPHGDPKLSEIALQRGANPRIAPARDRVRGAEAFWTVHEMRRNLSAELLAGNLEEAMPSDSEPVQRGPASFTL